MWKKYKYVFYWLYTWQERLYGERDVPEYKAILGMTLSLLAIFYILVVIISLIFDVMIIPTDLPRWFIVINTIGIIIIHYFLFINDNKYLRIKQEFNKESEKQRRRKRWWVLFYVFGSWFLYIFILLFGIWLNKK